MRFRGSFKQEVYCQFKESWSSLLKQVQHLLLISFTEMIKEIACSPPFLNYWWKKLWTSFCFNRPLARSPSVLRSQKLKEIGWCDRDEILKFSIKMHFKSTTCIISRIVFCLLRAITGAYKGLKFGHSLRMRIKETS